MKEQNQSQTRENEAKANGNCASTLVFILERPSQSLCPARRVCSWPACYAAAVSRNVTNTFLENNQHNQIKFGSVENNIIPTTPDSLANSSNPYPNQLSNLNMLQCTYWNWTSHYPWKRDVLTWLSITHELIRVRWFRTKEQSNPQPHTTYSKQTQFDRVDKDSIKRP